jgi:hypothetical protein
MKYLKQLSIVLLTSALVACGGGGGNASAPVAVTDTTGTATIANIVISSVDPKIESIKADGVATASYVVRAVDQRNGVVVGATIKLGASAGLIVSPATVTTDADGKGTVSVIAGTDDQTNRIATLTAECTGCSASVASKSVNITGASLTLSNPSGSNLVAGGNSSTLSVTVKNVSGGLMAGVPVSFASTDPLIVGVTTTPALSTTNSSGVASATVAGLATGSAGVNVTALGAATRQSYTTGTSTSALSITSPANNAALITNTAQTITVSAPGATSVVFTSTLGTFANGLTSQAITVSSSTASAVLTVPQSGVATVTAADNLARTSSIKLYVTPASANKVLLSVNQTTVAVATGQTTPTVRLRAQAVSTVGASDQSVANIPIVFSMSGGPGGGEYLSTSFQFTDSFGYAYADFYSGVAVSIANGISVAASIQGTAVQTGVAPSSNNVALTIGGQALSVAFGAASVLRQNAEKTLYISDHSVVVTDANNNPVSNAVVTLRLRPVAFSTGTGCVIAATHCSEDANANGSLDAGEDGARTTTTAETVGFCPSTSPAPSGTLDGILTPQNSWAGAVPSTVTTGADGTANFALTYLKGSSIWVVDRLTATVSSSGTESSGSTIFRLRALEEDVKLPDTCYIPDSPFAF